MTTNGAVSTASINATMTLGCELLGLIDQQDVAKVATVYPNPFTSYFRVILNDDFDLNTTKLFMYDAFGRQLTTVDLKALETQVEIGEYASGFYFYKIISADTMLQSGTLISK